ncbi:MAG: CrcB family protein [Microbacteriaceae bacterium]|nr:CrcB family protein [Microbacteriaceae bacterium]
MPWRDLLAVLVGGAVGTALRLGIDTVIPHGDTEFPVSTLVLNTVGAFALGMLVGRVWQAAPGWLRAGLGAGLLGSFTTFSALAVSLVSLTAAGFGMLALAYLAATLALGLAAAALGLRLGSPRVTDVDLVDE